jgi:hypothetical protein
LVRGSTHECYGDQIFDRRHFLSWVALDPVRMKTICDSYLLAFFDEYVRGMKSPLLRQWPSPFGEVELLKDSAHRFDGISAG